MLGASDESEKSVFNAEQRRPQRAACGGFVSGQNALAVGELLGAEFLER